MTIKSISIKNYLAERGIVPVRETPRDSYYLSPLRSEATPSFHVNNFINLWHDFGTGEGGSIIDLVMKMEGLTFREAATKLERGDLSSHWATPNHTTALIESPIKIMEIRGLNNPHLINYLNSRVISINIASKYCREVHYTNNGKPFYAIGFKNDQGGWDLRNEYFKGGSSPKHITTIDNGSDECLVFEGFIDMLSYVTLNNTTTENIMVLNSIANIQKALPFLRKHTKIHTYLDNDTAGCKTTDEIKKLQAEVVDHAQEYHPHNDLNDYLRHTRKIQPKRGRRL